MWDYTDGCTKQYHCASAIYLLSCIYLEFSIIIYRAVGAPEHGRYVVDGMNDRDKRMFKLAMANILKTELI